MKKKGFTLVELLAVIAILAILVIVAMPNVLGMFNQAKYNTFVTEVQSYMDSAKTAFVSAALGAPAQDLVFATTGTNKLSMSGNKNYYIKMDRYGNYLRVVVWDTNFCFDSGTKTAADKYDKTKVTANDVKTGLASGVTAPTGNNAPAATFCNNTKANAQ